MIILGPGNGFFFSPPVHRDDASQAATIAYNAVLDTTIADFKHALDSLPEIVAALEKRLQGIGVVCWLDLKLGLERHVTEGRDGNIMTTSYYELGYGPVPKSERQREREDWGPDFGICVRRIECEQRPGQDERLTRDIGPMWLGDRALYYLKVLATPHLGRLMKAIEASLRKHIEATGYAMEVAGLSAPAKAESVPDPASRKAHAPSDFAVATTAQPMP